ncbi:putative zinc/iron permease [Helianthus annuus]|uniref:Putative ZIP metal ion transporter family n=1 Tax=Helianthus annuus TaxID=4232 RepID=A0A251VMK6_HELAN|nr:zinc transporter 6, chloroplastic [Helianthus annuus]KAF5821684.1 putative zinc/iron permease [Helianthus annuus]KAJ0611327.1 putative zinc/iron permease [Helianthus annuus]KAJ0626601.1 putative zinc/iron permease [Helianthus annuus]KAJ0947627.1 putative zinc/iron permease [Helianthus annuus]KAJ0956567.1 putative zinc/iron permease [Helianthus annuus]
MTLCAAVDSARTLACRDGAAAATLKFISMFVIFFTSVIGISAPVLLARLFHGKPLYDKAILIIKCFAAGVILSTSLVHVLPDAYDALADCQVSSHHPWKDFPFSGLITLIGVLTALLVDLTATSHVDGYSHGHAHGGGNKETTGYTRLGEDEEMKKTVVEIETVEAEEERRREKEEEMVKLKQRMVSQVLEIGIIFHSVIIGVTMGMSQNQCTIKPLVAALAFHQIFEGMGLGGCIAQAGFKFGTTAYMCIMFSVTTPMGIALGMILFSMTGYDDSNPNALIMEGLLGSLSSGILIYMGLVDLIALDFFHNKLMSSETWLKKISFVALVLGSTSMSILALWA